MDAKINSDAEAIGQRLREVRGDMTQTEFAEKLGIDRQTITRYETGKRVPDALVIKRLIEMNIDAHWLLTGGRKSGQTNTIQALQDAKSLIDVVIANLEKKNP